MNKRLISLVLSLLTIANTLHAQIDKAQYMPLQRTTSGHYAFYTLLNDKVMGQVMIETGIYTAIIDSAFYFKHREALGITALPNDRNKEMNLGGTVYRITHRAKEMFSMGNMKYKGEILILANYKNDTPITLPIQNLYHRNDWGSRIIMLDLDGGKLQMITRNDLQQWSAKRFKINRNTYGRMPAIKSTLVFDSPKGQEELQGNFNIDLGNPMLLYLLEQSTAVKEFLEKDHGIRTTRGTTRNGSPVNTLTPHQCTLLGQTFENPVICTTDKLTRFKTEGLIGLPFFKGRIVAFDFENNYLYLKE